MVDYGRAAMSTQEQRERFETMMQRIYQKAYEFAAMVERMQNK